MANYNERPGVTITRELIQYLLKKNEVVVAPLYEKDGQWSNTPLRVHGMKATSSYIIHDKFVKDTVFRLKYRHDGSFEVEIITRDIEGEMQRFSSILTGKETKVVPKSLASLMKEVLETEQTKAVKSHLLQAANRMRNKGQEAD